MYKIFKHSSLWFMLTMQDYAHAVGVE